MEYTCVDDQREVSVACCACRFPLPPLCQDHAQKHLLAGTGFHFILPLTAFDIIRSGRDLYDIQPRLFELQNNIGKFQEKLGQMARCEELVNATYQELQRFAYEAWCKFSQNLALAKAGLSAEIEQAVCETRSNALNRSWIPPPDSLTYWIWSSRPDEIADSELFNFHAQCESIESAFNVGLQFNIPALSHLNFGDAVTPLQKIEELQKMLAIKDEAFAVKRNDLTHQLEEAKAKGAIESQRREQLLLEHRLLSEIHESVKSQANDRLQENSSLKKQLAESQVALQKANKRNQELESLPRVIQGLEKQLQDLRSETAAKEQQQKSSFRKQFAESQDALQKAHNRNEELESQLQMLRSESAIWNQQRDVLEQERNDLRRQVKVMTEELDQQRRSLVKSKQEANTLRNQVQDPANRLPQVLSSPLDPAQIPDPQNLIAVLKDQVKCFNVTTSMWQHLLALRKKIEVDGDTSSTFISPSRILVCGGGDQPCIRHIGNRAYMLEGDGSVQELPCMPTGRKCPGVAWDSVRQALYVFGGHDGRGTCYTVSLRASEMFQSKWSPLPHMHQARRSFNPCWYSSFVYLCGGYDKSVETYCPGSNTFVLQNFTLPENSSETIAVVEHGTLTVISERYISKLQHGRLTSQKHGEYYPWSSSTPLVSRGAVCIYYGRTCRCIDLTSGAVVKEVKLS